MAKRRRTWARWLGAALLGAAMVMGAGGCVSGPKDPSSVQPTDGAASMHAQALGLYNAGRYGEAAPLAARAVVMREQALGAEHPLLAESANLLGMILLAKGDHARAEVMFTGALAIFEHAGGPQHPTVAMTLNNLGLLYSNKGDYARAKPLLERALRIHEARGRERPEVVDTLTNLGDLHQSMGEHDLAVTYFRRALEIDEKVLGGAHPRVGMHLTNLGTAYREKGDLVSAERLRERALAITEKAFGPEHLQVVFMLKLLAEVLYTNGDYSRAEGLLWRALVINEKVLGPEDADVGLVANNLATMYFQKGEHGKAEPLLQRALAIFEKTLGPEHPKVGTALDNLAQIYLSRGDYTKAEELSRRGFAIHQRALGTGHVETAFYSTNNRALLAEAKGDYARAEELLRGALVASEKELGPDHAHVAGLHNSLGALYGKKGDHARAEEHFLQALAIFEKVRGAEHVDVVGTLNNLGLHYIGKGEYAEAGLVLERALKICEKASPEHPLIGKLLNNIGQLYGNIGDVAREEEYLLRSLGVSEKATHPEHPELTYMLNNLARLYQGKGDFARAEPMLRRALAIAEKARGKEHPQVAMWLRNLSDLHLAQNDVLGALRDSERAAEIEDRNAVRELAVGSDDQRRAYMTQLRGTTDYSLSLHARSAPQVEEAKRFALRTVLRRKGLVLDAMANTFGALRGRLSPEDARKFDAWRSLGAEYSALAQRGPGETPLDTYRAELQKVDEDRKKVESELSFRSKDLKARLEPVTLEAVSAALPKDSALVELFRYQPFIPEGQTRVPARYVAYVLFPTGEVSFADLEEAPPIDGAVDAFRKALARAATDPKPAARDLYERVMVPIRRLLGETRHVYLSPDAALSLVPFGALMDEDGHYVLETHSITYLASGRDLVRPTRPAPREGAAIFAAPDYEAGDARGGRSARQFEAFRRGAEEGRAVAAALPNSNMLDGAEATEAGFKSLRAPSVLHVSTHAFFEKDLAALYDSSREILGSTPPPIENALLRSGLGFAGANRGGARGEDGILTALEASQLDLWGTKLVVLSGCETGMGQAENGDGVYGLRRAFTMAGAETVVMSLWEVEAPVTLGLMKAYYGGLSKGGGRGESLRTAQLAMLASKGQSHPHHWASFIVSGDDTSMDLRTVDPTAGRVNPGARGCTCKAAGATDPADGRWCFVALAMGAGLAAGRRKSVPR
jgi:tetratricopeptide (TPR) repeat protein